MKTTPIFGLKVPEPADYADLTEWWGGESKTLEAELGDISYLMDTYPYTWTMQEDAATGALTITVTLGSDCPVTASMTAVIADDAATGETTVEVTTTIDGTTTTATHTIGDDGGEGGQNNG